MQTVQPNRWTERLMRVSYHTLVLGLAAMIVSFAFIYFFLSYTGEANSLSNLTHLSPFKRFLDCLYFSVITTTTVGYGDIIPHGVSRFFTAIQSLMGFSVAAFFVTKLLSYRQEVAITHIHKLGFEEAFQRIREGLYIIRKDFDMAIKELSKGQEMTDHLRENLATAFADAQSLLEDIPDFYNFTRYSYTIDPKREQLLLEAFHRTLKRLERLLQHTENRICADPALHEALQGLLHETSAMLTWWEQTASSCQEQFLQIRSLQERMEKMIDTHVAP